MAFSKQWHALMREAQLAGQQIATGATALGRANHAQTGLYTEAFFGLSIGLERLAKLIIVAEYAISNSGRFPSNDELRKKGHDIAALLDVCETLSIKHRKGEKYADRPKEPIHQGIISTVTEFGKLSRYYNLDLLVSGKAAQLPEPIEAWWSRVGQPILFKHYSKHQQERDRVEAAAVASLLEDSTYVLHHSEKNEMIDDIGSLMLRAGATRIVQKYGRLYTLQIVRWMAFLISDLSHIGAYERRIDSLLGLNEPFATFMCGDDFFRTRKTWCIYP